jgi:hypothetical protein
VSARSPSCTSPIATRAASSSKHFSKRPSTIRLYSSPSNRVYLRAWRRIFLFVMPPGSHVYLTRGCLQSVSLSPLLVDGLCITMLSSCDASLPCLALSLVPSVDPLPRISVQSAFPLFLRPIAWIPHWPIYHRIHTCLITPASPWLKTFPL